MKTGDIIMTIYGVARITYVRGLTEGGLCYETTLGIFFPNEVEKHEDN
jgi:hypothetical protein